MKEENKNIKVSIVEVNENSYKQNKLPIPESEVVFGKNLTFNLAFNFDISVEDEMLKHKTLIKFVIKGIKEPVIELETELVYHVINLKNIVNMEDNKMSVDDSFLGTIIGVSLGTSRGILAKNTKGTALAKFPLPILNPAQILKNMKSDKDK